jgi:hypothetical protein
MLVGSNSTEGGGFFQRKEPPPGHDVCVCLSGADGRVVEGRINNHREVSTGSNPVGKGMGV